MTWELFLVVPQLKIESLGRNLVDANCSWPAILSVYSLFCSTLQPTQKLLVCIYVTPLQICHVIPILEIPISMGCNTSQNLDDEKMNKAKLHSGKMLLKFLIFYFRVPSTFSPIYLVFIISHCLLYDLEEILLELSSQ